MWFRSTFVSLFLVLIFIIINTQKTTNATTTTTTTTSSSSKTNNNIKGRRIKYRLGFILPFISFDPKIKKYPKVWKSNVYHHHHRHYYNHFSSTLSLYAKISQEEEEEEENDDDEEEKEVPNNWGPLNIAFVTGNEMKAREMNLILAEHGATKGPNPNTTFVNLRVVAVDLPEIQEISTEAVAKNKAIQGAQLAGGPCVVEDTSLELKSLGGMPGTFIKWFQQSLNSHGLYKILYGYEDKTARAVCTLAFCPYPHADPVLFTGDVYGQIVEPVPGRGFGWDSIFVPNGETKPFSCMSIEEKNKLSHRGKAVRQWANWLGLNRRELWERQCGKSAIGHKGLNFRPEKKREK